MIQDRSGPIINLDSSARSVNRNIRIPSKIPFIWKCKFHNFFFQKLGGGGLVPPAPPPAQALECLHFYYSCVTKCHLKWFDERKYSEKLVPQKIKGFCRSQNTSYKYLQILLWLSSHFEYCCKAWDPPGDDLPRRLQRLQNGIERILDYNGQYPMKDHWQDGLKNHGITLPVNFALFWVHELSIHTGSDLAVRTMICCSSRQVRFRL